MLRYLLMWLVLSLSYQLSHAQNSSFQHYKIDQAIYTKEFTNNDRKFGITLHLRYPHVQALITQGKEWSTKGILLVLQKYSFLPNGQQDQTDITTIWQNFSAQAPGALRLTSSGNAYIDIKERKIYQVLTDGDGFGIQILNLDDDVSDFPDKMNVTVAKPESVLLIKLKQNRLATPIEFQLKPIHVKTIKIDKQNEVLMVTLGTSENPTEQVWSISLEDRIWKKTFDAKENGQKEAPVVENSKTTKEIKSKTTDTPPLIETLLWKELENSKVEGTGLTILRGKTPLKSVPPGFEKPKETLIPPNPGYLYWATYHRWRDGLGYVSHYALWKKEIDTQDVAAQLEILDAAYTPTGKEDTEPGVFVMAYLQGKVLLATVTRPDGKNGRQEMPTQNASLQTGVTNDEIKSVAFIGTGKDGTMALKVEFTDGSKKEWKLEQEDGKDQWAEITAEK